jgi:prepilin-type processing-associated H-X9-DG protein
LLFDMDAYLGGDPDMNVCPSAGVSGRSYGAHPRSELLYLREHVVMLDAHMPLIEYETTDSATWNEDVAPRHAGRLNALFLDNSVVRRVPPRLDPYHPVNGQEIYLTHWKVGEPSGGGNTPGLFGEYWAQPNRWSGTPGGTRVEGLTLPFGVYATTAAGYPVWAVDKPFDIPLPGWPGGNSCVPLQTARWTGQIRAEHTEQYTFWVTCDNNAWVYVDGTLVLSRFAGGAAGVNAWQASGPVSMEAGRWADIEVRCEETGVGTPTHVWVQWESPSMPRCDVPMDSLSHVDE